MIQGTPRLILKKLLHIIKSAHDNIEDDNINIILGAERGTRSYMEKNNSIIENEDHTQAEYLTMITNFYLTISDGRILIKNLNNDKIFLRCEETCKQILKDKLTMMTLSFNNQITSDEQQVFRIGNKIKQYK